MTYPSRYCMYCCVSVSLCLFRWDWHLTHTRRLLARVPVPLDINRNPTVSAREQTSATTPYNTSCNRSNLSRCSRHPFVKFYRPCSPGSPALCPPSFGHPSLPTGPLTFCVGAPQVSGSSLSEDTSRLIEMGHFKVLPVMPCCNDVLFIGPLICLVIMLPFHFAPGVNWRFMFRLVLGVETTSLVGATPHT